MEQVESEKAGILLSGRQLEQRVSDRQSEQLTELRLSQEREAEIQREVERLRQALRQSELDTRSAHARLAEAAVASPVSRNREVLSTSAGRDGEGIRKEVMNISQALRDMNRRFEIGIPGFPKGLEYDE